MNDKVEEKKVVEIAEENTYSTAYDMLKSLFWHVTNKVDCKGSKMLNDSIDDKKTGRNEVGWKCSNCNQAWRISVRQLRNTIRDARLKEFGGFTYMSVFADLRKVLEKK